MQVLESIERRALLPISRGYAAILSFIALVALVDGIVAVAVFHILSIQPSGSVTPPVILNSRVLASLAPAPTVQPAPQTSNVALTEVTEGRVSEEQRVYAALALAMDPEKTAAYFRAYENAPRLSQECGGVLSIEYAKRLTGSLVALSAEKRRSAAVDFFSRRYCELWKAEIRAQEARIFEASERAEAAVDQRNSALVFSLGCLLVIAFLALPLALFAIERNTRMLERVLKTVMESKIGLIGLLIFGISATVPIAYGQVPIETEQQRRDRLARENETSRQADLASYVAERRRHVGQTYVFNPSGRDTRSSLDQILNPGSSTIWFYRQIPSVFGTPPSDRFQPQALASFTVLSLDSQRCYRSDSERQYLADSYSTCWFYRVRFERDLVAYLELGRHGNRSYDRRFEGIDALSRISFDPSGFILAARPEELSRRAEQERQRLETERRVAAEREAEARRQAAERDAEARRQAAEREAEARRQAAEREVQRLAAIAREEEARRRQALERRRVELREKYSDEIVDGIISGQPQKGWPASAVREAWGEPRRIVSVPPADKMWEYRDRYITLEGDTVNHVILNK